MSQTPQISVVMPVRNGARYVADALASVLAQNDVALEAVVVDDGSTDRTRDEIARIGDERVRVIPGPEKGVAAAMNAGLEAARGTYLARCDSDDRYPVGRLREQLAFLESKPEFGAVCGRFEVLDRSGHRVYLPSAAGHRARELTDELRAGRVNVHLCTYLARREPMLATGGFRSYFRTGSDIDFQLLLCERTRVWYEPVTRYGYRFHDNSLTHLHSRRLREFNESMARRFQSQRAARADAQGLGLDDLQLGKAPPPPELGEAQSDADLASAEEQLWQMRWGEAWREHAEGRHARGVLVGLQATLQQPWRPAAWRGLAALCVKSTPLWRRLAPEARGAPDVCEDPDAQPSTGHGR